MPQVLSVGARSSFVDTVAWLASIFALAALVMPLVDKISGPVLTDCPAPEVLVNLCDLYLPWFAMTGAALALATLSTAIGLLMRLDWARQVFIALLLVAILVNLACLWLQHVMVQGVVSRTLISPVVPLHAVEALDGLALTSQILGGLMAFGLCGLFGWTILRLTSLPVRQEFV